MIFIKNANFTHTKDLLDWRLIGMMIFLILTSIVLFYKFDRNKTKIPRHSGIVDQQNIQVNDFTEGKNRVKLVFFYTYDCGFCNIMNDNLKKIRVEYGEDVRISYNPYYLYYNDTNYLKAKYEYCASENKREEVRGALFTGNFDQDIYSSNLSEEKVRENFLKCVSEENVNKNIELVKTQGDRLGILGVPALIINDKFYNEGLSLQEIEIIINKELKKDNAYIKF